jgi:hypothetical protein
MTWLWSSGEKIESIYSPETLECRVKTQQLTIRIPSQKSQIPYKNLLFDLWWLAQPVWTDRILVQMMSATTLWQWWRWYRWLLEYIVTFQFDVSQPNNKTDGTMRRTSLGAHTTLQTNKTKSRRRTGYYQLERTPKHTLFYTSIHNIKHTHRILNAPHTEKLHSKKQ